MNKLISLTFSCLLVFSFVFAEDPVGDPKGGSQSAVINDVHDEWTLCLEDGSCWKVLPLKNKRKKTWYEWYYNIVPKEWALDESYFFDPRTWKKNCEIQVYNSSGEFFPQYGHIIENKAIGQKAFAEFIPFGGKHIPKLEFAAHFLPHPYGEEIKILSNQSFINILILENHAIWILFPATKRSQSWEDWWNNVHPDQPDLPFLVNLVNWNLDDTLQIYYCPALDSSLNAFYSSKEEHGGMFLIVNQTKNQMAFAKPISLLEFANYYRIYAMEQWEEGYRRGYEDGYSDGEGSCDD